MFGNRMFGALALAVAAVLVPGGAASAAPATSPPAEQTGMQAQTFGSSVDVSVEYYTTNGWGGLEVDAVKTKGHPFSVSLYPEGPISARVSWKHGTARIVVDGRIVSEFWPQGKNANPAYRTVLNGFSMNCSSIPVQRVNGKANGGSPAYVKYEEKDNILISAMTAGASAIYGGPYANVKGFVPTTLTWNGNYPLTEVRIGRTRVDLGYDRHGKPVGTSGRAC